MEIIKAEEAKKISEAAIERIRIRRIETAIGYIDQQIKKFAKEGSTSIDISLDDDIKKPIMAILSAAGYEVEDSRDIDNQNCSRVSW